MMHPDISIIMPTFDRLCWLRAAVASVFSQTHRRWELILVDDGSHSPTRDYLHGLARADPRVRVIWREHCGNPPRLRNAGLRAARAQCIGFLDSDDLWVPGKLERQLASLRRHPGREWSYTAAALMDGEGEPLAGRSLPYPAVRDGWIADALLRGEAAVTQSSVLVRRASIERVGGYPEDLPVCGDYELFVRLALRSEVDFIPEDLVRVRRHGEHYSDDFAALTDLYRFLGRMQRSGLVPHLARTLRARRGRTALRLARAGLKRSLARSRWRGLLRAHRPESAR